MKDMDLGYCGREERCFRNMLEELFEGVQDSSVESSCLYTLRNVLAGALSEYFPTILEDVGRARGLENSFVDTLEKRVKAIVIKYGFNYSEIKVWSMKVQTLLVRL